MSSILDTDFLEIADLKMENQRLRNQLIDEQNKYNGLSNVVCKWIEMFGDNYIEIPRSSTATGPCICPYISGDMCTDLRSLIDSIVHGNISTVQAYMSLFDYGH